MTRDKKIEVRLTEQELKHIENMSDSNSVTKSELIRQAVRNQNNGIAEKRMLQKHIFDMQTIVNQIYQIGATTELLNTLRLEMNALWQYLN